MNHPTRLEEIGKPDISIILPTYGEENRIRESLAKLRSFLTDSGIKSEIIVVNDPGFDRTEEIVREFTENNAEVRVILVETGIRLGKGGAIRVGVERATADVVFFMDADLPTDLSTIIQFYRIIGEGADCVFGRRLGTQLKKEPLVRRLLSKGFHSLFKSLFGLDYDTQCGVKCTCRTAALEIFEHVTVERLAYDVDFVVQARKHGFKVAELDIPWYFRSWSTVRIWKTTLVMFLDLFAIWLKNFVAEPSLTEDEAEIARFYDSVRGDTRFRAANSMFLPRRIWYARKDSTIVREVASLKQPIAQFARVLDVGFGSGNNLESLRDLGFSQLTGIDVSKESVNFLRKRSQLSNPIRADARKLPLASDSFDVIICRSH